MIRANDLRKTYDRRSKRASHALRGVSFDLPETGFVCIVGPSGCGKTSLLNAIGGLDTFDGGSVSTESLDALRCGSRATEAERNRSFGYIFQNYYLLGDYNAAYNVYLGLHSLALSHDEKLERVREALRAVDMERFARRAVGKLSGGQQQRVAIARALARRPRVIFADEPTGNLDEANTRNICTLLRQISRRSLVVMVTHEERIARFFADRIITIEDGVLTSDTTDWRRGDLADETPTLYTSEYDESVVEGDGVTLRLLREEDAAPIALTVVAEKNRIVIKLDDRRTLSVGASDDAPALVEGERPVLKLEQLEQDAVELDWDAPSPQGRAGSGLKFPTLLREARRLLGFKGLRRLGSWLFLVLLTVMTLFAVGDYLMVASIEPEDFITTDSHILELNFARGEWLGAETLTLDDLIYDYTQHLEDSGLDFEFIPNVSLPVTYSVDTFTQMASESENLGGFSYLPLEALDESTLILGRAPENASEIAVDRWVLEKMMERDGIIQSGITDVGYFLGRTLDYLRKDFSPEIVGITDCGEPAVFFDRAALVSIGVAGTEAIRLSDLQKLAPGVYDDLSIGADECVVITNNAGVGYASRIGGVFTAGNRVHLTIASTIEQEDTFASIVVADDTLDEILRRMLNSKFYLYCADKQAMKDYIAAGLPADIEGNLIVDVIDRHDDAWASYRAATELRADERSIVTAAIILLSLVMLYLLRRSDVHSRIGMIAVYRLLGIPMRKLAAIFALEALLFSLVSALPAAVLTCIVVAVMEALPSLETSLLLPWHAAAIVYGCILAFHVAASLLPLVRLGRLPPAHLARESDL